MYNPQLEIFIKVVDRGSFSKAAEDLFISPSAVIKQINILETNLGLKLLKRTHQGVSLTPAGASLYRDAKYLIKYAKDSIVRAHKAMEKEEMVIRIGTSNTTPSQFLIDLWPQIHELCPNLRIQLIPFENTPENAREILANLGDNIDLVAGVFEKDNFKQRGCDSLEIKKESICLALSIYDELSNKDKLSLQDIHGRELMLIKRGWNKYVDEMRDDLIKNDPTIIIKEFEFFDISVFNECENNKSLLMSVKSWKNIHPLIKTIPVEWDYYMPYGLLFSLEPSRQVIEFVNAVKRVLDI